MSALRTLGFYKPPVLGGIDALGLMMIAVMILIFGPLATVEPSDVSALAGLLVVAFVFGVPRHRAVLRPGGQAARLPMTRVRSATRSSRWSTSRRT